jgi:hypothetical protein
MAWLNKPINSLIRASCHVELKVAIGILLNDYEG